jgi:hypothetical protein
MSSLYFGPAVFCLFEASVPEFDMQSLQGEGPTLCYDVKYMDCTAHGIGASKFPLLQQENLTIELLRAV